MTLNNKLNICNHFEMRFLFLVGTCFLIQMGCFVHGGFVERLERVFFCPVIDYSFRNKLSAIFKQDLKRH